MRSLHRLLRSIRRTLVPDLCCICGCSLGPNEEGLCLSCLSKLPYTHIHGQPGNSVECCFWGLIPIERAAAYIAYRQGGQSARLFSALKYHGRVELGQIMGRQMAKAMKTSHVAKNEINRQFRSYAPRKALLTDITYIFYRGGVCYLSPILDVCTHEVLAYRLSDNLRVDFVLDMVDAMCSKYGAELDNSTIVHSDQGCHYTSNAFIRKLKDASFVQSMSRKGNCWDNAPQESFFGHMKDEIAALIAGCDTYEQVQAVVADWMDYYNKDRYQWDLEKLSPREYYCYRQTGVYPLKPGISKKRNSQGSAPDPEV